MSADCTGMQVGFLTVLMLEQPRAATGSDHHINGPEAGWAWFTSVISCSVI